MNFFVNFAFFDDIFIVIILLYGIVGLWRGVLQELISVLTWVVVLLVILTFVEPLSHVIKPYFNISWLANFISALFSILAVLMVSWIVKQMMGYIPHGAAVSLPAHVLGLILGVIRGVLITGVLVFLMAQTPLIDSVGFSQSKIAITWRTIIGHREWNPINMQHINNQLNKNIKNNTQ